MKAIANTVLMCTTNQNGKTAFNHKAANTLGLTFNDLEVMNKIGHRFHISLRRSFRKTFCIIKKVENEINKQVSK